MLVNQAWQEMFESIEVNFQCEGEFDHSPALLIVFPNVGGGKKNLLGVLLCRSQGAAQFLNIVGQAWSTTIQGSKMFEFYKS